MEIGSRTAALSSFLRRLQARSPLNTGEQEAILALRGEPQKVAAHRDFVRLGEEVRQSCLIVSGLVARFAQLDDGSRQIISLHIAGDMVDLYSLMLPCAPSPLHALTDSTVIRIPHEALRQLAFEHRGLSAAFWRDCVIDGAIIAQWLVNVGRKHAQARIAHLLGEMAVRYAQIGQSHDGRYPFPITQEQLADALGLTAVHVNRSLRSLREARAAVMTRGMVSIIDWNKLAAIGEFDPAYLHLPAQATHLPGKTGRQTR